MVWAGIVIVLTSVLPARRSLSSIPGNVVRGVAAAAGGGGSSQLIYKGSSSSSQPSVKTNIFLHLYFKIKMPAVDKYPVTPKYICIFPGLATSYLSWGQMPARCWQQLTCPHPGSPHMSQHWSTLNTGQHWSALVSFGQH